MEKYPGVRQAMKSIGHDTLDASSMQDVFTLGFISGRLYEAEKDRERLVDTVEHTLNSLNQAE